MAYQPRPNAPPALTTSGTTPVAAPGTPTPATPATPAMPAYNYGYQPYPQGTPTAPQYAPAPGTPYGYAPSHAGYPQFPQAANGQYGYPSPYPTPGYGMPPGYAAYPYVPPGTTPGQYPTAYIPAPGTPGGYAPAPAGGYYNYYGYPQQPQQPVASTSTPAPATPIAYRAPAVAATPTAATLSSTGTTTPRANYPAYTREGAAPTPAPRARKQSTNFQNLFTKDLKRLMYGFGDDPNPSNDTVAVMEEILVEYIMDVCQIAGNHSKKSRLSVEDLRRALSRPADAKKLARMEELLFMQEVIIRARSQFEEDVTTSKDFT